ncbi:MAG: bifunctional phosphopantothenoylcysteine decarboxylase/phosphopantothenate--cysteine ligase CoaBC [Chitinophagaceae bacterium]
MFQGKKILIGISGSIAAYKIILLTRLLTKAGAEVKIVMTPAAKDFVSPLTLSTLAGHPVLVELADNASWSNHVMLGRWADILLIAPLSCNTLAKMASGQCDNLLLATWLSATCPVMVAPAMDEDMWHHPTTKANLDKLERFGVKTLQVGNGPLASGLSGDGRMAEPEDILKELEHFFFQTQQLKGKKVLITAGPTHERIDPVRFIGNHSSGKMGQALAIALANRGAEVTLVSGPVQQPLNDARIEVIPVVSAQEMYNAAVAYFPFTDLAIMAAAVADYMPVTVSSEKIKKKEAAFSIELTRTPDILKKLGETKRTDQLLVGFALESTNEKDYAKGKLAAKNADFIVMNSLRDAGAGFGHDTNKITVFGKDGTETEFPLKSKKEVATDIVNLLMPYLNV